MIYLEKINTVMLSVPKTGTTSWQRALKPHANFILTNPPQLKHLVLTKYLETYHDMILSEKGCAPEIIVTLREPVSWLNSWYRYRMRPTQKIKQNSTVGMSFEEFVKAFFKNPRPSYANIGKQQYYIRSKLPHPPITIFKYESTQGLKLYLEEKLGVSIDLPHINVSPKGDDVLSVKTLGRVKRAFRNDFQAWDNARDS